MGGLWLAQNFKTALKVILWSHHTHPLSEKGPRSQETQNLSSAPLDRQSTSFRSCKVSPAVPLTQTAWGSAEDPHAPVWKDPLAATPKGLEGAQCFPKADLLSCLQPEVEVLGRLKDEHNGGAQVELSKGLALAHGNALLVGMSYEAQVIVGALAVPGAVCVQVLGARRKKLISIVTCPQPCPARVTGTASQGKGLILINTPSTCVTLTRRGSSQT